RADRVAREQQPHRALEGDVARQPVDAAAKWDEAEPRPGQAEPGLGRGHDDVAGEGDLQAAAETVAVDRGDDRLADPRRLGVHRPVRDAAERDGAALGAETVLIGPLEVEAGRERLLARARENRDADLRVAVDLVPDLHQL